MIARLADFRVAAAGALMAGVCGAAFGALLHLSQPVAAVAYLIALAICLRIAARTTMRLAWQLMGASAAMAVVRHAAIRAAGGARLPWREFIANLSAAVGSICGTTAGDLVFHAGLCLRVTEAA